MTAYAYLRLIRLWLRLRGRNPCAIILLERMGDIAACGPVARELKTRDPEAWVLWICTARFADLARAIPGVDSVLSIDSLDHISRLMPELSKWTVVDLTLRGKTFEDKVREWTKSSGDPAVTTESYYHYGPLLRAMCLGAGFELRDDRPLLNKVPTADREVDHFALPESFVAIHCTSDESARNWNAEGWRELVLEVLSSGRHVVEIGHKPSGLFDNHPLYRDLTGRTSIPGTAELLRRARLFIGIDSGPAHLANAVDTPGLILLGRYRVFDHYFPYTGAYASGTRALILQHHEECPFIPTPVVLKALRDLLGCLDGGGTAVLGTRATLSRVLEPSPSPGNEIVVNGKASGHLDILKKRPDGQMHVEGWAAFVEQRRAPDNLLLARDLGSDRFQIVQSYRFTRLERPDISAHFNDPRLSYTGWNLRFPSSLWNDESALLVHDAQLGRFSHLVSLPKPAP